MSSITFDDLVINDELLAELCSDHAGEYGAVAIYQGILAFARTDELKQFATHHLATEVQHLAFMESFLPRPHRTRLLPLWKLSGWLLGALPTLVSPRAVFITIESVERFVESHYQRQLVMMENDPALASLRQTLSQFCADEVSHKIDAAHRRQNPMGVIAKFWSTVVATGSAFAVAISKRF